MLPSNRICAWLLIYRKQKKCHAEDYDVIPNLAWLIPMALDNNSYGSEYKISGAISSIMEGK